MSQKNPEWLTKYPAEIFFGVQGTKLDAYAVALEGWRRGLTLKWHSKDTPAFKEMKTWYVNRPGQLFSLQDQDKIHYFFRTRGDLVSNQAVEIGADKWLTKTHLNNADVPVPKGQKFVSKSSDQEIIDYALGLGFPLVIKPTDDSFGRGVIANILNIEDFRTALKYTRHQQQYKNIIVEEHVSGDDYRLYVVGEQVVGAIKRTPPHIVGDGKSSIKKLIKRKNKIRKKNPRLASCLIKIDQELIRFLQKNGKTLRSVPKLNEQIQLNDKNNISIGGDAVDRLDQLTEEVKSIAVSAVKAIPNLYHCGVDMMIDHKENKAVVIEINPTAQIGSLLFPGEGKARDIPAAIIDLYFPKSTPIGGDKPAVYFSFNDEIGILGNRSLQSINISNAPVGNLVKSVYKLKGRVSSRKLLTKIRKQVLLNEHIHGYIKKESYNEIKIVTITNNLQKLKEFELFLEKLSNKINVVKKTDVNITRPVKIGFSMIGKNNLILKFKRRSYQYKILRMILACFELMSSIIQSSLTSRIIRRWRNKRSKL